MPGGDSPPVYSMVLNDSYGVVHNTDMNDPQPIDPRRRIRELLSIPERDRTDAEWDELNELEIRTAPGNRDYDRSQDRQSEKRPGPMGQGRRPDRNNKPQGNKNNAPRPQQEGRVEARPDGRPEGRMLKRQHRRPKRQGENQSNSGNSAPAAAPAEPVPSGQKSEG